MHLQATLAVGLSLLGLTLADTLKNTIEWKASDFAITCGSEDCNYNFNIVSTATGPSKFKTSCSGVPAEKDYTPCQDKGTEAKLQAVPGADTMFSLHIQHTWMEGEARYTAHGDANITDTQKSFTANVDATEAVCPKQKTAGWELYGNCIGFPDLESPLPVSKTRERILPESTPPGILCQLLALMTRIQRPVHACFHPSVARCLAYRGPSSQSRLHTLAIGYFNTRPVVGPASKQPTGVLLGPPTWFEEQRLVSVLLHVVVFYELAKTHTPSGSLDPAILELIQAVMNYEIEDFCDRILRSMDEQSRRVGKLLEWLKEQAGGRENMHTWLRWVIVPDNLSHSCHPYTSTSRE
ncbi:hypothetical protein AFGD_010756 [Aspergillus flavus]|nr:hypothetical protein AFGD_010756 [Aspergillus flavus]